MSKAASVDLMEQIHAAIAKKILDTLNGDPSGTDVSNAIKFLKDSGIMANPGDDGKMAELVQSIQDVQDDDPESNTPSHTF